MHPSPRSEFNMVPVSARRGPGDARRWATLAQLPLDNPLGGKLAPDSTVLYLSHAN